MYRDDADAAKLRIQTLEAKLAEQEAGLRAREAEITELRAGLERMGKASLAPARRTRWPAVVAVVGALIVALGAAVFVVRARHVPPPPGSTGVAACDVYLGRLEACGGGNPATQAAFMSSRASMLQTMRDAALGPESRAALASACGQGLTALESSGACVPEDLVRTVGVESDPPGARVVDLGVEVCARTPCTLTWRRATAQVEHRLTLRKPGYEDAAVSVAVADQQIRAHLAKSAP